MTPQLRFPKFTDEWLVKRLGDFSRTFSGGTPSVSNKHYYDGDIPFIKSGEITKSRTEQFINESAYKNSSAKMVSEGDILYALYGATSGQVAISKITGAINQAILCIKPHANNYFVYSKLLAERDNILKTYLQGGQGNLSAYIVKKIKIALPSEREQQEIADFLTAVDEKIAVLEHKCEQLERYKRGVMQQIFSQKIRFKQDDGSEFPEWKKYTLGTIGKTFNGLSGKSGADFESGENFITYMQVYSQAVNDTSKYGHVRISPNEKQESVKAGDIIFTTSSETPKEVGMTDVVLNELDTPVYLNSFCFGLRLNSDSRIDALFAKYLFRSPSIRIKLSTLAQGSTRFNLSKNEVLKMVINIPEYDEQQKIATFLESLDQKITLTRNKLDKTKEFKKALLQRMFV